MAQLPIRPPGWVEEFRKFIMRGNVVDLAVGIIIGAAFTAIVASLVKDIFNPVIGLLVGGIDFSNIFVVLKGERLATLEATQKAGGVTLNDCLWHLGQEDQPFGGVGASGQGAYHGVWGFNTFSHRKPVFSNPTLAATQLLAPPYGTAFAALLKVLKKIA